MIFSWIFSIVSLVCLLIAKQYAMLAPGTEPLLLSLSLIVVSPWMIPIIHEIKKDLTLIDGRIFFIAALAGLISTILALIVGMPAFAEQSSIWVYLMLVGGVVIELLSPLLMRGYQMCARYITLPPWLQSEYQSTLREYSSVFVLAIGIIYIVLLVWRTMFWDFDLSMLLLFSFGMWLFLGLVLLTHSRSYGVTDLYDTELGWTRRLISPRYRHTLYPIIWGLISALLVDIAFFRGLALWMQGVGIMLIVVIVLIGSLIYPVLSRWIRSNRYIQGLFL